MTKAECLKRMKAPGDKRGDACFGVMQIIITNRCDLGTCSNCTQLIPYQNTRFDMTLDNAKRAIDSVAEYPGVVGIFGGNPVLHPEFAAISRHLADVIPDGARRGLWANNLGGHADTIRAVYGYYNLNVHGNNDWAADIKKELPWVHAWGAPAGESDGSSMHGAVLVPLADVVADKAARWELIAECDVNQRWSPAITEINGSLCGFFCEVAAAFAGANGDDARVGLPIAPGWWELPIEECARQVDRYCHQCGIPLRIAGRLDSARTDDVSGKWVAAAEAAGRKACVVGESFEQSAELTDYLKLRESN